ncbi:hypothetical protein EDD15DRAFT_955197 [Pisolithus albus]|nr:hypothetical protein EDD15DRAFT_955197 [Pisolithus albus]
MNFTGYILPTHCWRAHTENGCSLGFFLNFISYFILSPMFSLPDRLNYFSLEVSSASSCAFAIRIIWNYNRYRPK